MPNFSLAKQATSLLVTKSRSILFNKSFSQASKGPLVEVTKNEATGLSHCDTYFIKSN